MVGVRKLVFLTIILSSSVFSLNAYADEPVKETCSTSRDSSVVVCVKTQRVGTMIGVVEKCLGLWQKFADGTEMPMYLPKLPGEQIRVIAFSPDSASVVFLGKGGCCHGDQNRVALFRSVLKNQSPPETAMIVPFTDHMTTLLSDNKKSLWIVSDERNENNEQVWDVIDLGLDLGRTNLLKRVNFADYIPSNSNGSLCSGYPNLFESAVRKRLTMIYDCKYYLPDDSTGNYPLIEILL